MQSEKSEPLRPALSFEPDREMTFSHQDDDCVIGILPALECEWVFVGSPVTFCSKVFRAGYLSYGFSSLLGRVVVKRFQTSPSIRLMSVAGSALLFGIGTEYCHRPSLRSIAVDG